MYYARSPTPRHLNTDFQETRADRAGAERVATVRHAKPLFLLARRKITGLPRAAARAEEALIL